MHILSEQMNVLVCAITVYRLACLKLSWRSVLLVFAGDSEEGGPSWEHTQWEQGAGRGRGGEGRGREGRGEQREESGKRRGDPGTPVPA